MRSCDEILELISAALDGELSGEEQAELDEHLSQCPACGALYAQLAGLHQAAAQLEEVPAPPFFAQSVMDAVAAESAKAAADKVVPLAKTKKKTRASIPWKGWAATAAIAGVVILGASLLPSDGGSGSDSAGSSSGASMSSGAGGTSGGSSASVAESEAAPSAASAKDQLTADAVMDAMDGASAQFDAGETRASGGSAPQELESAALAGAEGAPEAEMEEGVSTDSDDLAAQAVYCGVLTVNPAAVPAGLEDFEGVASSDGTTTYLVSADYFFAALAELEGAYKTTAFTHDQTQADPNAEYGLIIVQSP